MLSKPHQLLKLKDLARDPVNVSEHMVLLNRKMSRTYHIHSIFGA